MVSQILSDAVYHQMQQFMLFVEEKGHGKVSDLLLGVFGRGDKIHSFQMTEIDIPSEYVYV